MITCPIHYCIALLATAITVVGLLGPTRALATGCTADVSAGRFLPPAAGRRYVHGRDEPWIFFLRLF